MEKLKHTPGPWKAETATCGIFANYPIKKYESEIDKISREDATHFRTIQICQIETDLGRANYTEEQRANQKLIAAAPEMLEALIWAKEQFKRLADEGKYPEFMLSKNGGQGVQPIVNAIHKAIE